MPRQSPGMGCTAQQARRLQPFVGICMAKSGGMESIRQCLTNEQSLELGFAAEQACHFWQE